MVGNHYSATTVITTKGIMQNNGLRFFKNVNVMKDNPLPLSKKGWGIGNHSGLKETR